MPCPGAGVFSLEGVCAPQVLQLGNDLVPGILQTPLYKAPALSVQATLGAAFGPP
jgi:hypothetical protein